MMRSATSVTLYLSGTSLVVAMFASGCAMFEPRAEAYAPPPVGSSWTQSYRNTGSYGKDEQRQFTRIEGTWQGKNAVALKMSNGATIMLDPENGGWMAIVAPNGKPVLSWEPPIGWQYPLYVGRSWTISHRQTAHAANRVTTFDWTCKVEGYGDVSVPAGTFKAFEIACSSTTGNNDRYWYSPDVSLFVKTSFTRTASNRAGPGTQQGELVSQTVKK